MRAAWLAAGALAIALIVQLSVLNGLHLPGGGVPDLVLVLVAALAMAAGPVRGMVIGFVVGLCLDVAPPGSELVGQYALVFCLAGWAAGRLSPVANHSARQSAGLLATALLALVVAAAEVATVVVGKLAAPAAVTLSQVRLVLPSTIAYDLILCPFVLYLVMLGSTVLADRPAAQRVAAALPGTTRSRRAAKRARRLPDLHLGDAAGVRGGWLSTGRQAGRPGARSAIRSKARLRPAAGVPGSASGLQRHATRPPVPVHIRLGGGGRRGDGVVGTRLLGSAMRQPGRHPGLLAGSGREFRPHGGEPGGSATRSHGPARPGPGRPQSPPAIRFGGRRGDGSLGTGLTHSPRRPMSPPAIRFGGRRGDGSLGTGLTHSPRRPMSPPAIRFGARRGDGSLGTGLASGQRRPRPARRQPVIDFGGHSTVVTRGRRGGPRLRMGARRSAITPNAAAVPALTFTGHPVPVSRRAPAVPRFRRKSSRSSAGVVTGGALSESTFRTRRPQPTPRLRLSGRAPGMLGGSGRPLLRRPPSRLGRQPKFSYGKRSPLTLLAGNRVGRRLGGRWLARQRAGSRSGVWLLGRRTGGPR